MVHRRRDRARQAVAEPLHLRNQQVQVFGPGPVIVERGPQAVPALNGRTPQKVFTDGLPKKENAKMKPKQKAA